MSGAVASKTYPAPPLNEREILRYAGGGKAAGPLADLLRESVAEAERVLTYRVCCRIFPVEIDGAKITFGPLCIASAKLAENLRGCDRAALFAATVGLGLDRLIAKYGRLSPAKALLLQAVGAERIEALCDAFCADLARETGRSLRPRFSPGYGDLPLTLQREILPLLDCGRRLGLTLNDSLLLSPSKSVTAIVGLNTGERESK